MIKIKTELKQWLVNFITNSIRSIESEDCTEFNSWVKAFKKEEASFVVDMEFINDWGYDERSEVPEEEAILYARALLERILSSWYM